MSDSKPKKSSAKTKDGASKSASKGNKSRKLTKRAKSLEILHLALAFVAVFLLLALVKFQPVTPEASPEGWGSHTGLLGRFGGFAAEILIRLSFGRWGAFAMPALLFIILGGWWSRKPSIIIKPAVITLAAGFYTGFGIAFFRQMLGLPPSEDLSGVFLNQLLEATVARLGLTGTGMAALLILLILLVILADMKFSRIAAVMFWELPRTIGVLIYRALVMSVRLSRSLVDRMPRPEPLPFEEMEAGAQAGFPDDPEEEVNPDEAASSPPWDPIPPRKTKEPPQTLPLPLKVEPRKINKLILSGPVSEVAGARKLPPIDLLDSVPLDRPRLSQDELDDNSRRLEDKLGSLKIEARVIRTVPGPIITRYDLKPAPTVKIARIASSADDIAMALRAPGVRILAPIPGEAAVGVEIPNRHPETVYIREAIGSEEFRRRKEPLTIALGKDSTGGIYSMDLAKAPHLLIAGATGSGKSVCINMLITSILFRCDPDDVRLVLVDPKKLELSLYARLIEQHLVAPPGLGEKVITTPENAVKTLQSVHIEMERRYDILADAGVRGLDEYNRWLVRTAPDDPDVQDVRERLPYLVVIIDELADLMMVVRKEFEELVARLAQMARAVGIHLVVATQRPSVDVVTGLIKANFPSRIAFQVASKFDSRTILDVQGAETLLGRGDMLYQGPGTSHLMRLHGALVTTEEVERVVEFVRAQPPRISTFKLPDPEIERVRFTSGDDEDDTSLPRGEVDELFEEAARIIVRTEQGSISVLQRRLRVGYARAARLVDQLEKAGIVGPFDGSKAREVLVTLEELKERYGIE